MRKCLAGECCQKGRFNPHSKISIAFSFSPVFWIDASSVGTVTQGLKGICNLPAAKSSGLDGSYESALNWIGSLKENYIIVFDNADVLSPTQLEAYFPPPEKGGNILITSRNSAMQCLTLPENSFEVTEMEEKDAIELLLKSSCLDPFSIEFHAEACKIVKELFCLPLAIDQAGAYVASGATTIKDYLSRYSEHREILLSHSEFTGASRYNRSVYRTWELSYEEIEQRAKGNDVHRAKAAGAAMLLLELFPFFHHEGITEKIFFYAALQSDEEPSSSELPLAISMLGRELLQLNRAGTWDNLLFGEGIRVLLSFSLIKKGLSDGVYAMHPLVHTWGRDRLTLNERRKCCLMAYVTLSSSLREGESQPYEFQRLLVTHVRENILYSRSECDQKGISYLDDAYAKFGGLLQKQGYAKEAEILQVEVLDTRNRILGVEHQDTIRAMASLASTNRDLGRYTEAEKLKIQVLEATNRILGVEHPDTIDAMGNLADTYSELGKYTEAERLRIQVLDARNRILGVEHLDTITAMGDLAVTYRYLGKYTEAEKLVIQVLDARNRILGVEHPDTISAMSNLAEIYHSLGKYKEAEKLNAQVLDAMNKIFRMEHPETIRTMANQSAIYHGLGKYKEAEKLQIQVLDARNRILGVEHPDTITTMGNLAATYQSLGRYTEAEKLNIQVLEASTRILGVDHPDTIRAMANLGSTYHSIGRCIEAAKLEIQVLDARNIILGVEHPDTIMAMENLAATYESLGKYTEAEKLNIQVLNARNRILGVDHPDTIRAISNIAATNHSLEKYTQAEKLEIQAQEAQRRVFGAVHSHKIKTMFNAKEAQETQVLHVRSTVPKEEMLASIQPVLNPLAALPDTTMNPGEKGML